MMYDQVNEKCPKMCGHCGQLNYFCHFCLAKMFCVQYTCVYGLCVQYMLTEYGSYAERVYQKHRWTSKVVNKAWLTDSLFCSGGSSQNTLGAGSPSAEWGGGGYSKYSRWKNWGWAGQKVRGPRPSRPRPKRHCCSVVLHFTRCRIETPVGKGGQFRYFFVANLSMYLRTRNYHNRITIKVLDAHQYFRCLI